MKKIVLIKDIKELKPTVEYYYKILVPLGYDSVVLNTMSPVSRRVPGR